VEKKMPVIEAGNAVFVFNWCRYVERKMPAIEAGNAAGPMSDIVTGECRHTR
jgi:hypothetical protein